MLEPAPAVPGKSIGGLPYPLSDYAVCDKCHDVQSSIMLDRSFKHREYVKQAQPALLAMTHTPLPRPC
jgi:hypothetical protein